MTSHPHTTGETLEQILDRIIFEDPATHRLRDEWEQTKRIEQEVFERVCREEYETRLEYHRICQTPEPEAVASRETNLCTILFREELAARLTERWAGIYRRVQAVLAAKTAESEGAPPPGGGSCTDDPVT